MMAADWLRMKLAESPEPLRGRLEAAVGQLDDQVDLSAALFAAACCLLESTRGRLDRREAAFDLLTADGLLTLACEAAALDDPEGLARCCQAMGPGGEFGQLAERWVGRS
ncbi:MAG: hypothetical protein AMS25_04715 [Gemmatimonas sp. SM23_52]|nr:MAG: hypothetical protein AMS25_04715 [Gemmatimonas sp. SM23_52]